MFQEGWSANCWFFSVFCCRAAGDLYSATYNEKKTKHHRHSGSPWHRHAFGEKNLKGPLQQGSGGALRVTSVLFFFFSKVWQLVGNRCFYFFWWCMRDVLDVNIWNLQPYLMYLLIFGRCNGLLGKGCIMFMLGNFCIELWSIKSRCVSTYYLHMHINVRIYLLLIIYQNHRIYYSSHANITLYELISTVVHLLHVIPDYPGYYYWCLIDCFFIQYTIYVFEIESFMISTFYLSCIIVYLYVW